MTSSVAAARFAKAKRMSYCFASSRERTMIRAGLPHSPVRILRVSTLPSDPVPPVTSMRLPSNGGLISPGVIVLRVLDQLVEHFVPGRNRDPCVLDEARSIETSVAYIRLVSV